MFAIAVTDNEWFENIRAAQHQMVNFWTPTPWAVRRLVPGDHWYFMRKAPVRRIGGYGEFVRYREMPVADAWQIFGAANGLNSREEFVTKIEAIAAKRAVNFVPNGNPLIGCVELNNVVTADDHSLIDIANTRYDFPSQIVKYKLFEGVCDFANQF